MRRAGLGFAAVLGFVTVFGAAPVRGSTPYDERSAGARGFYTGVAVVANVVPIASAFVADKCLTGYVVCKLGFVGMSLVSATWQLVLSGGADLVQTKAILTRGFSGDWFLTGRHVAGDVKPQPYPEVAPPAGAGSGSGFIPPPL